MELEDLTLEVRDIDLKRVGLISLERGSFAFKLAYCNVGSWELTIPATDPMVAHLKQEGAGIRLTGPTPNWPRETLLSGPMTSWESKASATAPDGDVHFVGVTDDIILSDALAWPVPGDSTMAAQVAGSYDVRTDECETLMHAYVSDNIGPTATAARKNPHLTMGGDGARGPIVKKKARWDVLGTLLQELAAASGVGFRVVQNGDGLVFTTSLFEDRTGQIRLDIDNNTLSSVSSSFAGAQTTRVIVGGDLEGEDRTYEEVTTTESLAQEAAWGRRIERFVDKRSYDEVSDLTDAGTEILTEEGRAQRLLKAVPMDDTTMRYGYDWDLGDKVTVIVEGVEVQAHIAGMVILIDTNGVRVGATIGDSSLDAGAADKVFQSKVESRLSNLERNAVAQGVLPKLRLTATGDVSESSTGHAFQIGPDDGLNMAFDQNEIMVRNNGVGQPLYVEFGVTCAAAQLMDGSEGNTRLTDKAYVDGKALTYLSSGVNLNNYTTPGRYHQNNNASAAAGSNYPVPYAGYLEVAANDTGNMVYQRYTVYGSFHAVYTRSSYNGTWSEWQGDYDTGWTSITFVDSAFTSYNAYYCQVRRIGKVVYSRGLITRTGGFAAATIYDNIAQIPSGFRPSDQAIFLPSATNAQGTNVGTVAITSDGYIDVRTMNEAGSFYSLAGLSWLVD